MSLEPAESQDKLELPEVGERIRARRLALGISVREFARRLNLSPSLISQIERGKATPSVGTLYAITTQLQLSLDELFADAVADTEPANGSDPALMAPELNAQPTPFVNGANAGDGLPVHPEDRHVIELGSGVRWERLTNHADPNVDFLFVVYAPGGASCDANALMRHSGREYGHVLRGSLEVTIGFDTQILEAGDSISFDSTVPHRLATIGDEPAEALWFVVGRSGDARTPPT